MHMYITFTHVLTMIDWVYSFMYVIVEGELH